MPTTKRALTGPAALVMATSLAIMASGAPSELVVHVSLLAVSEQSTTEVPLDHEFRNGDRFRITVRPSRSGHLYLLRKTKEGGTEKIWPVDGGGHPVNAAETVTVPENGRLRFAPPAGRESIFLLFATSPLAEPEAIVSPGKGKDHQRMKQIRLREIRLDDGAVKEPGASFSASLDTEGVAILEIEVQHR